MCSQQDVDHEQLKGLSEFERACISGDLPCFKKLVTSENVNLPNEVGETPLHICSRKHHNEIVCLLTKMDACKKNATDNNSHTPLHFASMYGNVDGAMMILSVCPESITSVNLNGKTVLHSACEIGCLELVEMFVHSPLCNVNQTDIHGRTALHLACLSAYKNSVAMLSFLSSHSTCNPNVADKHGHLPIQYVSNLQKFQAFVKNFPHALTYVDEHGNTLLHCACRDGNVKLVKYLLNHYSIICRNNAQQTPLHFACGAKLPSIQVLIDLVSKDSTQTNAQDQNGDTPLHIAIRKSNLKAVKFLVEVEHADVNLLNHQHASSLHLACMQQNDCFLTTLLDSGRISISTANSLDTFCFTPLMYACRFGELSSCHMLMKHFRSSLTFNNYVDSGKNTLLHIACRNVVDNVSLIVKLLDSESWHFVNVQNHVKQTALHEACKTSTLQTCKASTLHGSCVYYVIKAFITSYKCNLKLLDVYGKSALCYASRKYYICELFWRHFPAYCVHWRSSDGNTLFHYACTFSDCHLLQELLTHQKHLLYSLNKKKQTALHFMCIHGCTTQALEIVLKSINKDFLFCTDRCGKTALDYAYENKKYRNLILLSLLRDPTIISRILTLMHSHDSKKNILFFIACNGCSAEDIAYLLTRPYLQGLLNAIDDKGRTALHIACLAEMPRSLKVAKSLFFKFEGYLDHLSLFLSDETPSSHTVSVCQLSSNFRENLDITVVDMYGLTALDYAYSRKYKNLCKLFLRFCVQHLDKKSIVNSLTTEGNTLLHLACEYDDVKAIRALVVVCDVNAKNDHGETPLFFACRYGTCDTVKALVLNNLLEAPCQVTVVDRNEISPFAIAWKKQLHDVCALLIEISGDDIFTDLHDKDSLLFDACNYSNGSLLKVLQQTPYIKSKVNFKNTQGKTPLHISCEVHNYEAVKILLDEDSCNPNILDDSGQSPLHLATQSGCIQALLSSRKCDVNLLNSHGHSTLANAFYANRLNVCKTLLSFGHEMSQINLINPVNRDSLLHTACDAKDLPFVKLIVSQKNCITHIVCKNETPLHRATRVGSLDIFKYLLTCGKDCGLNYIDLNGMTLLNYAHLEYRFDFCKFLLKYSGKELILLNWTDWKTHNSILHEACAINDFELVQLIIAQQNCYVNAPNLFGQTPLHLACETGSASVVASLMSHPELIVNVSDRKGNTPIHVVSRVGSIEALRTLLRSGKANLRIKNIYGKNPLQVATNYEVIQTLSSYSQCYISHPLKPVVRVFFVGNHGTGKSTLISAFCENASALKKFAPRSFNTVPQVKRFTAGIIPVEFESKKFERIILYDLAGQCEYYSSHSAVIESSVESATPVFVFVNNISEENQSVCLSTKFWLSFIDNHCSQCVSPPHLIVAGSHSDVLKLKGGCITKKESMIRALMDQEKGSINYRGFVDLDCRRLSSSGLDGFRQLLKTSCDICRDSTAVSSGCHILAALLQQMFCSQGKVSCKLEDIISAIHKSDALLPQSPDEILSLLVTMHQREQVILFKDENMITESHVILNKHVLLSTVNGTLFAPENFSQHSTFANSTGVVPHSKIKAEFPQFDTEMIVKYLTLLEFCRKISDAKTTELIQAGGPLQVLTQGPTANTGTDEEGYYFFPALVRASAPDWLWKDNEIMVNKCGWHIQCINSAQFLTSRFLHVLLLRLAFSFPLNISMVPKQFLEEDSPVLTRQCSVWKNGVHWISQSGVEVLVEIGERFQGVTVIIRCKNGREANFARLRSAVIKEVLNAKEQFCPKVEMVEYMLHPNSLSYPIGSQPIIKFEMSIIAASMMDPQKNPDVIDQTGMILLGVEELLGFEPFHGVGAKLAEELFLTYESVHLDSIIPRLAVKLATKLPFFRQIIESDVDSIEDTTTCNLSQAQLCQGLFENWCSCQEGNMSARIFREKLLDKYSLLCGRIPMEIMKCSQVVLIPENPTEVGCHAEDSEFSDEPVCQPFDTMDSPRVFPSLKTPPSSFQCLNSTLTIESLNSVNQELASLASKWRLLGMKLGLQRSRLELIKANFGMDAAVCLTEMLAEFLERGGGPSDPNWKLILDVLKSRAIRETKLAHSIQEFVVNGYRDDDCFSPKLKLKSIWSHAVSKQESVQNLYTRDRFKTWTSVHQSSTLTGQTAEDRVTYGYDEDVFQLPDIKETRDDSESDSKNDPSPKVTNQLDTNYSMIEFHPFYGNVLVTCPYPDVSEKLLDTSMLTVVEKAVYPVAYKWFQLGLALGLSYHRLKMIQSDYFSTMDCIMEMLKTWISTASNGKIPPSWLMLVLVLDSPLLTGQTCVKNICNFYQYDSLDELHLPSNVLQPNDEDLWTEHMKRRQAMQERRVH